MVYDQDPNRPAPNRTKKNNRRAASRQPFDLSHQPGDLTSQTSRNQYPGEHLTRPVRDSEPHQFKRVRSADSRLSHTMPPKKPMGQKRKHIHKENPLQRYFREIRENRFWLLLFLWVALAWPEFILHAATAKDGTFLNSGLILSLLFAICPAGVVFVICTFTNKAKFGRFIAKLYALAVFILTASQLIYYRVFSYFYSVHSMGNAGQIVEFYNIILRTIFVNLILLLLMALPVLFLFLFGKIVFSFRSLGSGKLSVGFLVAALVVQLLVTACLPVLGGTGDLSAFDLYHKNSDPYASINRLGLFTALRLDFQRTISGKQASGSIVLTEPVTEPADTTTAPTVTESTEPSTEVPTEPPIDTSPNVLDLDFASLMENESNDSIRDVHAYFSGRTPSSKNAKTGMFEGCNLIILTAEGFDYLAVDKDRTPTLYKLMHEGFLFTNFYTPGWGVSTTDGEYVTLTGTIPKSGSFSFDQSSVNSMPLTMSRQLLKQGYHAFAYHGHTYNYYDRDEYLANLGYAFKAKGKGLEVSDTWPESDIEVIDLSTGDYVGQEPFTAYYMTISGHMLYTFTGNYIAYKNRDLVADAPYSENVRAYLACQIELDRSLELLMQRLEEAGIAENTVIALVADHYPYGLTDEEMEELAGYDLDSMEIYRNGCIIYKKGMTPEVVEEPCCSMDLLPTLSNLFGLEFDSRLYMGRDVFSNASPLVIFSDRSWITDLASYNSNTGKVKALTDQEVSDEYVSSIRNEVSNRFSVSARILDYDYWSILFDD